jgi:hypothetical protein
MNKSSEIAIESIKASPSITVGTMTVMGVQISDWVLILTIIYTAMQILFLLRDKWWRQRVKKKPHE